VSYVDSAGLGEIVAGYRAVGRAGGRLVLLNLTERTRHLLSITKLLTIFDSYASESEALHSFTVSLPRPASPAARRAE
jgi:anti-sigma B factor antagonist